MNPLISTAILVLIVVVGIGITLMTGEPIVEDTLVIRKIKSADELLSLIDKTIKEVSRLTGSVKMFEFYSEVSGFETVPEEDAIQFEIETGSRIFEPFSRSLKNNKIYISGNDVKCSSTNESIILENTYLIVTFKSINGSLNTSEIIQSLKEKSTSSTIYPTLTFIIDNNSSTGTGYTELLKSGENLPVCTVHAHVEATTTYDIYFKLYSYADFLVIDVVT